MGNSMALSQTRTQLRGKIMEVKTNEHRIRITLKNQYVSYIPKDKVKNLPLDDPYSSTSYFRYVCVDDDSRLLYRA